MGTERGGCSRLMKTPRHNGGAVHSRSVRAKKKDNHCSGVLVIRAEEEDATRKENLRLRPYKRQQQRSEKMRFYHAAPKETMMKIYAEGVLKKSWDGVVYMCKDPIDACKFLVIRGMRQMSVIELELDEKEVEESHDHSETFFKCKAYIKHGDIVLSGDERIFDYDFE